MARKDKKWCGGEDRRHCDKEDIQRRSGSRFSRVRKLTWPWLDRLNTNIKRRESSSRTDSNKQHRPVWIPLTPSINSVWQDETGPTALSLGASSKSQEGLVDQCKNTQDPPSNPRRGRRRQVNRGPKQRGSDGGHRNGGNSARADECKEW